MDELTPFLLQVIVGMLGIMCAVFGWWNLRISTKLDSLAIHKEDCLRSFANKEDNTEDHRRLWKTVDEHSKTLMMHDVEIENVKRG